MRARADAVAKARGYSCGFILLSRPKRTYDEKCGNVSVQCVGKVHGGAPVLEYLAEQFELCAAPIDDETEEPLEI